MPHKIGFTVVHASGEDERHRASELNAHGPTVRGWQSARNCPYPQELVLQLHALASVQRIQVLSHQYLIPEKLELWAGVQATPSPDCDDSAPAGDSVPGGGGGGSVGQLPTGTGAPPGPGVGVGAGGGAGAAWSAALFEYLGFITLSDNQSSGFKSRELKSVTVPSCTARYLKLRLHRNHPNSLNTHNQVGLIAINVLGQQLGPTLCGTQSEPNNNGVLATSRSSAAAAAAAAANGLNNNHALLLVNNPQYTSPYDDLAFEMYVDQEVARIIRAMELKKQQAVIGERFEFARKLKLAMEDLRAAGERLCKYELEKRQAIALEDFDRAKLKKAQMDEYRATVYRFLEVDDLLELQGPLEKNDECVDAASRRPELPPPPRLSSAAAAAAAAAPPGAPAAPTPTPSPRDVPPSPNHAPPGVHQSPVSPLHYATATATAAAAGAAAGAAPGPTPAPTAVPTSATGGSRPKSPASAPTAPAGSHPVKPSPSNSLPNLQQQQQQQQPQQPHGHQQGTSQSQLAAPPSTGFQTHSTPLRSSQRRRNKSASPGSGAGGGGGGGGAGGGAGGGGTSGSGGGSGGGQGPARNSYEAYEERTVPALRHSCHVTALRELQLETEAVARSQRLTDREKKQAALPIAVFGMELVERFFSKQFSDKEEGLRLLKEELRAQASGECAQPPPPANKTARAAIFLLHRALRDKVFSVYSAAAEAVRVFFTEFVPTRVTPAEVSRSVERLLPELLSKSGDSTPRIHNMAVHTILSMAACQEVRELNLIPVHLSRPLTSSTHPRLALSRLEMVEQLVLSHGISTDKNSGLTCRTLSECGASGLHHPAEAVRKVAERVLVLVYRVNPRLVRKQLPPDDDITRRNLLYRQLFHEFDRIDIQRKKEILEKNKQAARAANMFNNTVISPPCNPQVGNKNSGQQTGSSSSSASAITSPSDTSQHDAGDDKMCIFCLTRSETFTEEGLNVHYWRSCPMLLRCAHCKQVVEIALFSQHLLEDCDMKQLYKKCDRCTEAVLEDFFDDHVSSGECIAAEPSTVANHCPLCHTNIPPWEDGWRQHLVGLPCPSHPRKKHIKHRRCLY